MENNTIPPHTSVATTSGGLPPGYTPPRFAPLISSQTNLGTTPSILQNPLYQSLPLLATWPQISVYPQPIGTQMASMNMAVLGSIASTNPPTTSQQPNARPIFPTMSRNHMVGSPANTIESLAIFHHQIDRSHHDLANLSLSKWPLS